MAVQQTLPKKEIVTSENSLRNKIKPVKERRTVNLTTSYCLPLTPVAESAVDSSLVARHFVNCSQLIKVILVFSLDKVQVGKQNENKRKSL